MRVLFAAGWTVLLAVVASPELAYAEGVHDEASVLYEAREWQACLDALEPALKTNPKDPEALLLAGKATLHLETFPEAIPYFEALTKASPNDPDAWMWLGRALGLSASRASMLQARRYVGQLKKAFARALELDPDHVPSRIAMTQFYCEAPFIVGGSMRKARNEAKRIAKIDPVHGDFAWGVCLYFDGDYEDALARLESVRDAGTDMGMAYVFLGRVYAELGRETEAVAAYNKVFTLDDGASFAREELAKLRRN